MYSESNNTSAMADQSEFETRTHEPPDNTELYIVMGVLIFLSIVGTAGNALVLYVFSKKRDKLVSTLFILVMAFVDFTTCLVVIPYTVIMEYINFHVKYDIFCKLYQFLITSNIPFSALIMVAIAIDRYLCICHPFWHALNITRAKIMTVALGLFATAIGVVVSLMFGVTAEMPLNTSEHSSLENHTNHSAYNYSPTYTSASNSSSVTILIDVVLSEKHSANITDNNNGIWTPSLPPVDDLNTTSAVTGYENLYPSTGISKLNSENHILYIDTGVCQANTIILTINFQWYYQKLYTSMFLLCLLIVIVLYTLIYKSVLQRRTKRQKQKSRVLHLVQTETSAIATEETLLSTVNCDQKMIETQSHHDSNGAIVIEPKERDSILQIAKKQIQQQKRKSTKRDKTRMANLKTAAMLFVVTVVFILTFLPAFLMTNEMVPYNMIIFYMYFANNVANPVIYSFMNKNFRDNLRKLFCSDIRH